MLKKMVDKWAWKRATRDPKVSVKSSKIKSLAGRMEGYAQAAAFAEGQMPEVAQDMVRRDLMERPKILMVGDETGFSRPLVDYGVGFAGRMGYEIVALNVIPEHLKGTGPDLGPAAQLITQAEESGVPFRHLCKFGPMDHCIREAHDEIKRIEFVVTEPEAGLELGTEPIIPVFSLAN